MDQSVYKGSFVNFGAVVENTVFRVEVARGKRVATEGKRVAAEGKRQMNSSDTYTSTVALCAF